MDTKVNYSVVGAFVIVLTAAFVLMIIWLSSGLSSKTYDTYVVYMNESVAGLNIDSPVKFNGVEVGRVKKIALDRHNPQVVVLLLDIEDKTPVTIDTRATLTIQGLTGVASLALKTVGSDTTPLKTQRGQKYPVIKSAPSLLARLDVALSELTTNLSDITKSIRSVLNPENQAAIKATLHNFDIISGQLAKASEQFPATMQILTNQTLPATNQLLNSLQNASDNLTAITSEIKQNPAVIVRGQKPAALGPGER